MTRIPKSQAVTSANTDSTEYLNTDATREAQRSGVVIRNTSPYPLYAVVGAIYSDSAQLTTTTGKLIPPYAERVLSADPLERVWVKPSAIGQTFVLEQFQGTRPG